MSATDSETKSALIIGASRGLGLGLAEGFAGRGWRVVGTVRPNGRTGLHDLADARGEAVEIEHLDVADPAQIAALAQRLADRSFDVLFVNAGISLDPGAPIGEVSAEDFSRIMLTNAFGPMNAIETLSPLVPKGGVIGAMSSGLGSVSDNEAGGWEAYRASKAALNTLMRSYAARKRGDGHGYVVIAPGWVKTAMGGPHANLTVDQSVPGVIDAILSRAGKSGAEFLDYRGRHVHW